jgi:hypothetical protein
MNRISAVAVSEVSVTSPYRPPRSAPIPVRNNGTNSDYPLAPQRVRYAASAPARPVTQPQRPLPQAAEAQPKPSAKKLLTALAGVLMVSVGTVAGLVSIAALGPIGVGVAGGAALLGFALIRLSAKLK